MTSSALWQACVCAVLLSACGGSGGGSPSTTSNPTPTLNSANTNNQVATTSTNNQTTTISNTSQANNISGSTTNAAQANFGGVSTKSVESNNDRLIQFGVQSKVSGSSLNKIILDGKEITLIEPARNTNNWVNTERGETEQTLHTGYSYMRFGLYETDDRNDNDEFHFIAHGQLTDSSKVPTAGKATYTGHSLYQHQYSDDTIRGTSQFDVDYGNKKITGVIAAPRYNNIHLQGDISGNAFAGQLNGTVMQGRFFGANAEELGGTFHKGSNQQDAEFAGAFGAKK